MVKFVNFPWWNFPKSHADPSFLYRKSTLNVNNFANIYPFILKLKTEVRLI